MLFIDFELDVIFLFVSKRRWTWKLKGHSYFIPQQREPAHLRPPNPTQISQYDP